MATLHFTTHYKEETLSWLENSFKKELVLGAAAKTPTAKWLGTEKMPTNCEHYLTMPKKYTLVCKFSQLSVNGKNIGKKIIIE